MIQKIYLGMDILKLRYLNHCRKITPRAYDRGVILDYD